MTRTLPPKTEMWAAVLRRDASLGGLFVFAVRTTGVFCRPGCPARSPRPEHVEFFADNAAALAKGFRPCKRCRPMDRPGAVPAWLQPLFARLEAQPGQRLPDTELRSLGCDPVRVRRWFQRHRGMTFQAWQRQRRLGTALGQLQAGADPLAAGLAAGYASSSGFREAFAHLFGSPPGAARRDGTRLLARQLHTPLGVMLAAASETRLYLLDFAAEGRIEQQVAGLRRHLGLMLVPGDNPVLDACANQLGEYFAGTRQGFDLPLSIHGSAFQERAWQTLQEIPFGTTWSYAQQALRMDAPRAVRAVGRANGANRLAILIPCHRVIGSDGALRGYGGELWRKQALLDHEADVLSLPG